MLLNVIFNLLELFVDIFREGCVELFTLNSRKSFKLIDS